MESVQLDHEGMFGDPQVRPRVGNEYQVQIPPMIMESARLQLLKIPADKEFIDVSHSLLLGLPIPVMWIDDNVNNHKNGEGFNNNPDCSVNPNRLLGSKNSEKSQLNSNKKTFEDTVESSDVGLENEEEIKSPSVEAGEANWAQVYRSKSCSLVPGLLGDSWSDIKVDSLVLGLFIFGKDLVELKRFTESIEMGEILSFYYGKFYRSDRHKKWSNRRKKKKKCILGRKFFTGWRQQELLSRLLAHVSEEEHKLLVEVSERFAEEVTSLEEYFFTLKATVGVSVLIKAVGIDKGKEDLTSPAMKPRKANQVSPVVSKVPTGKACPSLTSKDIMKFLTGDVRLSKARSNSLFWEAVWPRLLARGWHSEKTKNEGSDSKKCFFLMPGVDMISGRKLVKGVHYFDSFIDILSKVAAEPELIELEAEEPGAISCNKEIGSELETRLDLDDPSNHQRHCYLKPRIPTSRETEVDSVVDSLDGDCIDMSMMVQNRTNSPYHAKDVCDDSSSDQRTQINGSEAAKGMMESHENQDTNASNEQQSKRTLEHQSSQRVKPHHANFSSSFIDILSKVAAEPELIELEAEEPGAISCNKEIGSELETRLDLDDPSNHQRPCYLKPRISTSSPNVVKFTVVDTSLAHGDKSSKVRELRSLPSDYKYPSNLSTISRETEVDSVVDSLDGDCIDMSMMVQNRTNSPYHAKDVCDDSSSDQRTQINGSEAAKGMMENQDTNASNEQQSKRTLKHQSSQRVKPHHANFSLPLVKRQRLTACDKAQTNHSVENFMVGSELKQGEPNCILDLSNACINVVSDVNLSQEKTEKVLSSSSLAVGTAEEESTDIIHGESHGTKMSPEKIERPGLGSFIDLNLLPIPSDSADGEFRPLEVQQIQENLDANISSFSSETNKPVKDSKGSGTSVNGDGAKEEPIVNLRRQSTRNRSFSTRAMEALASGFLSTKQWLKGTGSHMQENPESL